MGVSMAGYAMRRGPQTVVTHDHGLDPRHSQMPLVGSIDELDGAVDAGVELFDSERRQHRAGVTIFDASAVQHVDDDNGPRGPIDPRPLQDRELRMIAMHRIDQLGRDARLADRILQLVHQHDRDAAQHLVGGDLGQ